MPAARALWRGAPCPAAAELRRRRCRGAAGAGGCRAGPGEGARVPRGGATGLRVGDPESQRFLTGLVPFDLHPWRLWLNRGSLRRRLYLFIWLIKDVVGLMRGKCAPAGGSCLQPGFVVSPLGQDSPDKHLIVIKCDHLLMSGESFKDCFGVLIFKRGLTDCQGLRVVAAALPRLHTRFHTPSHCRGFSRRRSRAPLLPAVPGNHGRRQPLLASVRPPSSARPLSGGSPSPAQPSRGGEA